MMLRRRSKTPKRKPQILTAKEEELVTGPGTPQTTGTSSKVEEAEEEDGTMVLKIPLPSTDAASSSSRHRARSLTPSRSPFWKQRKQDQEYGSWVYRSERNCSDIFRKSERSSSSLEVDYMTRQFSSEYSFVEVILGDYNNKTKKQAREQRMENTTNGTTPTYVPSSIAPSRNKSTFDIPVEVMTRKRSTKVTTSKAEEQPIKTVPDEKERPVTPVYPVEPDAAVAGTVGGIPVAAIEVKRRRSDFVSELSEPQVVQRETVTSVRKALIKAQRRLAGAGRWGKKVSPEILLKAFMEVADSLESKRDRDMLRREMERILAEGRTIYEESSSASETEESTTEESYVPVGMCQFPRGPEVVDDELSETSSFVDWLDQTQAKRGKWTSSFDVFNLSNLWSDKLSTEWESFLQESDEESVVPFQRIESPPPIDRINSNSEGFLPCRASGVSAQSPRNGRSKETRQFKPALEIQTTKPESVLESNKTLLASFPLDPFDNEEWIEQEAQRILHKKSLQRMRSEQEKHKAEERELQQRASAKLAEKQKGGQHQMINKLVLDQFEMTRRQSGVLDRSYRSRSTSGKKAKSLQRSVPGQSVIKSEFPAGSRTGYQTYRPEIFPKFAAAHDGSMSVGSVQTNSFDEHEDFEKPDAKPQPQRTTIPYTQRLLARKKEQSRCHKKRRSKSMENPGRLLCNRLVNPRQLV